jgi:HK97 family phage major capsid protein
LNATLPIRTAVLSDINNLDPAVVGDFMAEFSALEGAAMVQNNDQSGTTTTGFGGTFGVRGLASYPSSTSAASYGTSGSGPTNGLHTILRNNMAGSTIAYNDVATLSTMLPAQYWHLPGTFWMMHPLTLQTLRELKDSSGLPMFLEIGLNDGATYEHLWGWKIVTNPYMDYVSGSTVVGSRFMYLAHWPSFFTIGEEDEMTIQRLEQTNPGYLTLFGEKRVLSSVRDPFAGVVLGTA